MRLSAQRYEYGIMESPVLCLKVARKAGLMRKTLGTIIIALCGNALVAGAAGKGGSSSQSQTTSSSQSSVTLVRTLVVPRKPLPDGSSRLCLLFDFTGDENYYSNPIQMTHPPRKAKSVQYSTSDGCEKHPLPKDGWAEISNRNVLRWLSNRSDTLFIIVECPPKWITDDKTWIVSQAKAGTTYTDMAAHDLTASDVQGPQIIAAQTAVASGLDAVIQVTENGRQTILEQEIANAAGASVQPVDVGFAAKAEDHNIPLPKVPETTIVKRSIALAGNHGTVAITITGKTQWTSARVDEDAQGILSRQFSIITGSREIVSLAGSFFVNNPTVHAFASVPAGATSPPAVVETKSARVLYVSPDFDLYTAGGCDSGSTYHLGVDAFDERWSLELKLPMIAWQSHPLDSIGAGVGLRLPAGLAERGPVWSFLVPFQLIVAETFDRSSRQSAGVYADHHKYKANPRFGISYDLSALKGLVSKSS